jgi:SRSO17 transposase
MVVRQVPRIVQGFLSAVSDQLGGPQVRHLNLTVTALLLVGSAKLKTLTHVVRRIGRHRTSLGHFLSRAFWPEADVLETASWRILKSMKPRRGEVVSLIIDDTRIAKRGRSMQALSRMWDHSGARFCHGHTVVVAAIRFRGVILPWRMQLWLPKDFAQAERLDYLKSTEIAAAMIRAFDPPAGLKVRVLFDAAYLCPKVTSVCENRGFT